jgi:hypothetical protein
MRPGALCVALGVAGALGSGCEPAPETMDAPEVHAADSIGADSALDAVDCAPAPPAPGTVRARVLACEADLPHGHHVAALPGDLVLENAHARFVVRAQREGYALLGLRGGGLVDAVRLEEGQQVGGDALRELAVAVDFWLLAPERVSVVEAGDAGVARVRVEGSLAAFGLIQSVLPLGEPDVRVVSEYLLGADSAVLEIRTVLTPRDAGPGPSVVVADVSLWGANVRLYVPGLGADALPTSVSSVVLGLVPTRADDPAPAYAMATDAPRALIDASGIKALLFADTPVAAASTTLTRRLALGPDLATAMAAVAAPGAPEPLFAAGDGGRRARGHRGRGAGRRAVAADALRGDGRALRLPGADRHGLAPAGLAWRRQRRRVTAEPERGRGRRVHARRGGGARGVAGAADRDGA